LISPHSHSPQSYLEVTRMQRTLTHLLESNRLLADSIVSNLLSPMISVFVTADPAILAPPWQLYVGQKFHQQPLWRTAEC